MVGLDDLKVSPNPGDPNSMNLPPDKARLLRQYDNEKKWELICDQERFQVKNPPHTYIQKLKGYLDPAVTRKKSMAEPLGFNPVGHQLTSCGTAGRASGKQQKEAAEQILPWTGSALSSTIPALCCQKEALQENADPDRGASLEVLLHPWDSSRDMECPVLQLVWVREFLNEENKGLDVLVEYLSFAQYAVTFDFESLENSVENPMDKSKPWSRSIEDLHRGTNLPSPVGNSTSRSGRHSTLRLVSLPEQLEFKRCQSCWSATCLWSSFTLGSADEAPGRKIPTKALVLELLAAVCLVRGGHEIILSAFDNFKEVCGEKQRFEKLMEHFRNEDNNIDFMVACMQFINIVVHSVEDMNFRVHLQYEFTKLGLDEYLDKLKHTESDKLQVQIQAYLDNVFDVGALLEDAETKNAALERVEELEENISHLSEKLQDTENEAMAKIVELEKQLMQRNKELDVIRVSGMGEALPGFQGDDGSGSAVKIKKPIKTKFRMPVFNWVALKPNQINGTVFNEIDDERILEDLNVDEFEEIFKTKAQGPAIDLTSSKQKITQKGSNKVTLLDANRAKNLAITLRKAGKTADEICKAIHVFDLKTLPVDFVECLMRFLPTENEVKVLRLYERERKPIENLSDEDRFMMQFSKIERLMQKMTIMAFIGNFAESIQMLTPIILALGNYMNSSKRGAVYGFKLQSLDLLLETKSTDRKLTLLHYISNVVKEKYQHVSLFYNELHYVEKAAAVSLENVLLDVKELQRGLELTKREYTMHDHNTMLKDFIQNNEGKLKKLQDDAKIAQDAFDDAVKYFGENPKTTPPSVFFPVFVRFVKAYKQAEEENELRKKQEQALMEKLMEQEALMEQQDQKSPSHKTKRQQQELIAELRRRQVKDNRHVYEGKDGAIEDIITDLRNQPYRRADALRRSVRRRFDEQGLRSAGGPDVAM
ncbi:formin-like protein 2 [Pitangus sulphuratus]|nr:formin-like protein 2 [Pitangus sulphuratus]